MTPTDADKSGHAVTIDLWRVQVTHLATTDAELLRRLPVVLDMMAAAREDGTHALRSVQQTTDLLAAAGIPMTDRTVKRHRAWAVTNGYAVVQQRGGRTSGATIYAATLPEHGTPARVGLSPAAHAARDTEQGTPSRVNVSPDATEQGTSTGQARDTATPEPVTPRIPLSPSKQQAQPAPTHKQQRQDAPTEQQTRQEPTPMDDATWLAAELDADPAACRAAIDRKRQQAEDRGRPWMNVTRMVRSVIQPDEWRQAIEQAPKPRPKANLSGECDGTNCPGTKHVIEHDDHRIICWGVA